MFVALWAVACVDVGEFFAPDTLATRPAAQLVSEPTTGELPEGAVALLGRASWGMRWPDTPNTGAVPAEPGPRRPREAPSGSEEAPRSPRADGRPRTDETTIRVEPLEEGRWATWADGHWTVWDPTRGAVARAHGVGDVTPDGAWIVSASEAVRLDPTPLERARHVHPLWWSDRFAARVAPLPEPPPDAPCASTERTWWSHDLQRVACADDTTLVVHDRTASSMRTLSIEDVGFTPRGVVPAPGGGPIAITGPRAQVALWAPGASSPRRVALARGSDPAAMAFTLDGSLLVALRSDGAMALVDAHTAERIDPTRSSHAPIEDLAIDAEGRIHALDAFGALWSWTADLTPLPDPRAAGADKDRLAVHPTGQLCALSPVGATCWGPDGDEVGPPTPLRRWSLEASDADGELDRLRSAKGRSVRVPALPADARVRTRPSPSETFVLVDGPSRAVVDPRARRAYPLPPTEEGPAAVDDRGTVWTMDDDQLWAIDISGLRLASRRLSQHVTAITANADRVVTGHEDGTLIVFDPDALRASESVPVVARDLEPLDDEPSHIWLRPPPPEPTDETSDLEIVRRSGGLQVSRGRRTWRLDGAAQRVTAAASEGGRLALASGDRLWIADAGGDSRSVVLGAIHAVALSADGGWVAAAGERGLLLLEADMADVRRMLATPDDVQGDLRLAFTSSRLEMAGGWAWSIPDGATVQRPVAGTPTALTLSDDTTRLAIGTDRGHAAVLDRATGTVTATFTSLGPVAHLAFAGPAPSDDLIAHDVWGGSGWLGPSGAITERRTWPWSTPEGLSVADDGSVAVFHRSAWWPVDPSRGDLLEPELTMLHPNVAAAVGTFDVRWAGPGISGPVPGPDAGCGWVVSEGCQPGLEPPSPIAATGLDAPRPSPDGRFVWGLRGEGAVLLGPDGIAQDLEPATLRTWTGPARLLSITEDEAIAYEADRDHAQRFGLLPGRAVAVAATGDRVVRLLERGLVVVEILSGDVPVCVLPAEGVSPDVTPLLAISPNGRFAAWGRGPAVGDLTSCSLHAARPAAPPIPMQAQPTVSGGVGWRFSETVHAVDAGDWLVRQDARGGVVRRALGATGPVLGMDPSGTFALTPGRVWRLSSLKIEHRIRRPWVALGPRGQLAWIDDGEVVLQRRGRRVTVPADEEMGVPTLVDFVAANGMAVATDRGDVHLRTLERWLDDRSR
ncbi:MAG: hypothetical protein KTR31_26280 [Myxococcales bacterium]|nr:hypothetical protein [Myxococcales bacterium]